MILGIGIDAVYIPRMERWAEGPGMTERFFHPEEAARARVLAEAGSGIKRAAEFLAARFAAKEAFGKALGTGLETMELRDIPVRYKGGERGGEQPELALQGSALAALEARGGGRVHLSLSHERDYAMAVVVWESAL
ncbi:MAG: holo-ACP synthase [Treponema sp.]|nr:holo-ACP synthase [Treponema sp.]